MTLYFVNSIFEHLSLHKNSNQNILKLTLLEHVEAVTCACSKWMENKLMEI